jgi:hypothetical protein
MCSSRCHWPSGSLPSSMLTALGLRGPAHEWTRVPIAAMCQIIEDIGGPWWLPGQCDDRSMDNRLEDEYKVYSRRRL